MITSRQALKHCTVIAGMAAMAVFAGCSTARTVPPLFTAAPQQESVPTPVLLVVPAPPAPTSTPIVITVPKKPSAITAENSIMRKGAVIKQGSSVVISVPSSFFQGATNAAARGGLSDELGFRTDGYFNFLEQYIERGLIAVGLQAKDRSKFEAKLRDLRDSTAVRGTDNSYTIAIGSLQKDLDAGKFSREEFAEKAKQLRDKLLDPSGSSRNRDEMTDISEVIRAAQDGDVMADYVLQVNDLYVMPYSGTPLQLAAIPEVQSSLSQNPGLRIGNEEGQPNAIQPTLLQPWVQARFNAKLIDVKTGSIDWIGEYSIESLAVLEEGITITIGVRRHTANGKAIVDAISDYNAHIIDAHQRATGDKANLDRTYSAALQSVQYTGTVDQGTAIQNRRRVEVEQAEQSYARLLRAYQDAVQKQPAEARLDWTYEYDVDAPSVVPDLLNTKKTEQEQQRLLEHVEALGFRVTHDLLSTIKIAD